MDHFDVAIVGYGPVGAVAANLLAPSGLNIAVFDVSPAAYDKPRATGMDAESVRTIQWCNLPGNLMDYFYPNVTESHFVGLDGGIIRRTRPLEGPALYGWPSNVRFIQPELEAWLRRGVDRYRNVEVFLEHEVLSVEIDADGATLGVTDQSTGTTKSCHARYVLGCDGGRSTVRKEIGTTFEDLEFDENWLVVDAWLTDWIPLPEVGVQYCWPWRPGTFVAPGPRNLRRWEFKLLPNERPEDFSTASAVKKALSEFVGVDVGGLEIWRSAVYRFHAIVADRWRQGDVFLLGDAAHQSPPFAGQGLCIGLRDVANLVWKIRHVEELGAHRSLLDTYEAERKPHARTVILRTRDIGAIVSESDLEAAADRDRRLRAEMAVKPVHYRSEIVPSLTAGGLLPDVAGVAAPRAGELFVQPRVREDPDGETRLLEEVLDRRFLLVASRGALDWLDGDLEPWQKLGGQTVIISDEHPTRRVPGVICVSETQGLVANWLSEAQCSAVIVRPDRYVYGGVRSKPDLHALIQELRISMFDGPKGPYSHA